MTTPDPIEALDAALARVQAALQHDALITAIYLVILKYGKDGVLVIDDAKSLFPLLKAGLGIGFAMKDDRDLEIFVMEKQDDKSVN